MSSILDYYDVERHNGKNYLVDTHNNKVCLTERSMNECYRMLISLENCTDCIDCENLYQCNECIECSDSSELDNCSQCKFCEYGDFLMGKTFYNGKEKYEIDENLIDFHNQCQYGGSYE